MSDKDKPRRVFREPPALTEPQQSQADKFREAAKQAETDDDEKRFDEKLKRLAKSPPPSDKSKDK